MTRIALLAALLLLAGCFHAARPTPAHASLSPRAPEPAVTDDEPDDEPEVRTPPRGDDGFLGAGLASWYGGQFEGRKTASGERFRKAELTAAHRTLPLGTCLRVRAAANGREVKVRINDRGPYHGSRLVDLSEAAADELDMRGRGVFRVLLFRC